MLVIVQPLEEQLGLKPGFFQRLRDEDDWSFVIKGHALIEAAVSDNVVKAIDKEELRQIFTKLDLRNKLAFANALKLLDDEDKRFISELSDIRNLLVHNVTQVDFIFNDYISQLDKSQFDKLVASFGYIPTRGNSTKKIDKEEIAKSIRESPKEVIWYGLMILTAKLYLGQKGFLIVLVLLLLLQGGAKGLSLTDVLEKAKAALKRGKSI